MSEKQEKVKLGRAAILAGLAAGALAAACDAPMPTELGDAVEEVAVDLGRRSADVERGAASLEGWDFLTYYGAPVVYLDGVRIVMDRLDDMPEPVRSFIEDPVWETRIERVEIVKSADAARLYGPEAERGIVHVVTKDPGAIGAPPPTGAEQRRALATAMELREAATETLELGSGLCGMRCWLNSRLARTLDTRAPRALKERQVMIINAAFLAFAPIVSIDGVRVHPSAVFELQREEVWRFEIIKGRFMACAFFGEEASYILLVITKAAPHLSQREALLGEDRAFTEEEDRRFREGCSGL